MTGRVAAAWRSGPLAVRSFRLLAGGQLTSTIGDYCYAVALPWLVLSSHGGVILLGTVLACYGVTRTVLIPLGGVLADKVGPRTVMLLADAVRCVLVAVLALLAGGDTTSTSLHDGIDYLLRTQNSSGTWDEELATGTGFPQVFYLCYHLYRHSFPLLALNAFLKIKSGSNGRG